MSFRVASPVSGTATFTPPTAAPPQRQLLHPEVACKDVAHRHVVRYQSTQTIQRAATTAVAAAATKSQCRLKELSGYEQQALQAAQRCMMGNPRSSVVAKKGATFISPRRGDIFAHSKQSIIQDCPQRRHYGNNDTLTLEYVEGQHPEGQTNTFERRWPAEMGISSQKLLPQQHSPGMKSHFGNELVTVRPGVKIFEAVRSMHASAGLLEEGLGDVHEVQRLGKSRSTMEARAAHMHAAVPWARDSDEGKSKNSSDAAFGQGPQSARSDPKEQSPLCLASPGRAPNGVILRMRSAQTSQKNASSGTFDKGLSDKPIAPSQALGVQQRGRNNTSAVLAAQRSPDWAARGGVSGGSLQLSPRNGRAGSDFATALPEGMPMRQYWAEGKQNFIYMPRKDRTNCPSPRLDAPWATTEQASKMQSYIETLKLGLCDLVDAAGNQLKMRRSRSADVPRTSLSSSFWEAPAIVRTLEDEKTVKAVVRMSSCDAVTTVPFRQRHSSAVRRLESAGRLDGGPQHYEARHSSKEKTADVLNEAGYEETLRQLKLENKERVEAIRELLEQRRNASDGSISDASLLDFCSTPLPAQAQPGVTDNTPERGRLTKALETIQRKLSHSRQGSLASRSTGEPSTPPT